MHSAPNKAVLFFFSLVFFFFPFFHAHAATTIDADVEEDTTWAVADSPYIISAGVTVWPGATLTIEPGTIVKFDSGNYIDVMGSLVANGTVDQKIYFTSLLDDTIGGDTNGDGSATVPDLSANRGMWSGVYFDLPEDVSLANANISFSRNGFDFFTATATIAGIEARNNQHDIQAWEGSELTVNGADLRGSLYESVYITDSLFVGDAITIADTQHYEAYISFGSDLLLSNAVIQNIFGEAIGAEGPGTVILDHVTAQNTFGIVCYTGMTLSISNSTLDQTYINTYDNSALNLDNTVVKNGDGIIDYGGTLVSINKSRLINNSNGVYVYRDDNSSNSVYTISDSVISGNSEHGVYAPDLPYTIDFSNTYWGDASGPQNATTNSEGLGNAVSDAVVFDPWLKYDPAIPRKTPILIVPGVMGTELSRPITGGSETLWLDLLHNLTDIGDEFMDALQFNPDLTPADSSLLLGDVIGKKIITLGGIDFPLFDYTTGLIQEFQNQGYVEGQDLFLFPYDWRNGASDYTVDQLKQKIADIMAQTESDNVDVVAHSTGGLLVKKYVTENPADHHIGKAVFVGVPNTGAPKAIKTLLEGDHFDIPFLSQSEMKKLSANLPVVYDLSPSQQYYDAKGPYVKIVDQHFFTSTSHTLDFAQSNSFLIDDHAFNVQTLSNAQTLHTPDFDNFDMRTAGIDLYSVVGCKAGTIGAVVEVRADDIFGNINTSYNAPIETPGDGTVPLESATNLPIDPAHKYYALNADHGKMMSQLGIRQEVVNILSGSTLSTKDSTDHDLITQDISKCELNGHAVSIYSPLSIDVVDQAGNHAGFASDGVSIENAIPNADYEIMGDHKFVYLPTDEGQTYTISLKGTGEGTFTLTDALIAHDQITETQAFKNIPVTLALAGNLIFGTPTTLTLDTDGDGAVDQTLQSTLILDQTQSVDFNPQETDRPQENTGSGGSGGGQLNGSEKSTGSGSQNSLVNEVKQSITGIVSSNTAQPEATESNPPVIAEIIPLPAVSEIKPASQESATEAQQSMEQEPQVNSLTASAEGSKVPIDKGIVLGGLGGIIILLFIVRKFIGW